MSPEDVAKEVDLIEKALEAGEISEKEADARIEKLLGNQQIKALRFITSRENDSDFPEP